MAAFVSNGMIFTGLWTVRKETWYRPWRCVPVVRTRCRPEIRLESRKEKPMFLTYIAATGSIAVESE